MGDGDAAEPARGAALRGAARGGRPRRLSTTRSSTSARPRRSATRAAPPATPRACCTRTARSAALLGHADERRHRALARQTGCSRSCRCSTPTPGACPTARRSRAADLILPDRFLDAESLAKLIAAERPTLMGCVPTIFADLLRYADEHPEVDLSSLNNAACGGSAVPRAADEGLRGAPRRAHLPGVGDDRDEPRGHLLAPPRGRARRRLLGRPRTQGRPLPWVELRLVDDDGDEVPWDGKLDGRDRGARTVDRGGATSAKAPTPRSSTRGWLRTGDIAAVDESGFGADHRPRQGRDQVRRRVDLLGRARERADVPPRRGRGGGDRQAATSAGPSARCAAWSCARALKRPQRSCVEHLRPRVAKWWLPDEFAFVAGDTEDERRQVRQEGAAGRARRGHPRGSRAGWVRAVGFGVETCVTGTCYVSCLSESDLANDLRGSSAGAPAPKRTVRAHEMSDRAC